jgi:hypothetical protein
MQVSYTLISDEESWESEKKAKVDHKKGATDE